MKLQRVLLRWYKSFHLNYRQHFDRGEKEGYRPWNELTPEYAGESKFPFVEIPIESDITTIVGGNESGKSHLLNAVNKVISGEGIDGAGAFARTDLCHYAGVRKINVEAWPNIGLQFSIDSDQELESICKAAGYDGYKSRNDNPTVTLILFPDEANSAVLFVEPHSAPILLDKDRLANIRKLLPRVQYINSRALLPSEIPLANLIRGYDPSIGLSGLKDRRSVEDAAVLIEQLTAPTAQTLPEFQQELSKLKSRIQTLRGTEPSEDSLEMLLFKQILAVNVETLAYIYELDSTNRGYIEGQIAKWNEGLNDILNLSHFWHQDDQFNLVVNYKDGVIYFEIHDKTECIYTFDERSSGLKYFLSYYIQAKAMEISGRNKDSLILMDEPDAALSILAQRNLLAVFESLVRPETSTQTCQLIYTTHSPYLINRNFPRRITVVKKEDAEEGTQYIEQARARRYEPVRSALGIDNAPSLFLGSDNILLEGATDQFLLTELIRIYSTPENVGDFLDLNSVVIVSADGVSNVTNVLEQSRWADEPIPPTAILMDSDEAAETEIKRIVSPDKPSKQLIPRENIGLVGELISPFGENKSIVTTEDIVPLEMYKRAIHQYIERWLPTILEDHAGEIKSTLDHQDFGNGGIVESTKKLFMKIQPELNGDFDKMGIFQEVIEEASKIINSDDNDEVGQLRTNVKTLCEFLSNALADARLTTARFSATRSIKRLIKDFCRLNKARVPITHVQKLFKRLEREIEPIGTDGKEFSALMKSYLGSLEELRIAGQQRLVDEEWNAWESRIESLKKNPIGVAKQLAETDADPIPSAEKNKKKKQTLQKNQPSESENTSAPDVESGEKAAVADDGTT